MQTSIPVNTSFSCGLPSVLAHLDSGPITVAERALGVRNGLGECLTELRDARRQKKQAQSRQRQVNFKIASYRVYARDRGVVAWEGHDNIESYCRANWSDAPELCARSWHDYEKIVCRLPEIVYRNERASKNLLVDICGREPPCRDWLCELIVSDRPISLVQRAVKKAIEGEQAGLGGAALLEWVKEQLARPDKRTAGDPGPEETDRDLLDQARRIVRTCADQPRWGTARAQTLATLEAACQLLRAQRPDTEPEHRTDAGGTERRRTDRDAGPGPGAEPVPHSGAEIPEQASSPQQTAEPVPQVAEPVPQAGPAQEAQAAEETQAAQGPAEAAAGPWYVPVVRAIVAHLQPEEVPALAALLVMALSGTPSAPLCSFVRSVGQRIERPAGSVREGLEHWLLHASRLDLEQRWPYLYEFFSTAQLPGFRRHLHGLRLFDLPASCLGTLKQAWTCWPLELPEDSPPPHIPADASEDDLEIYYTLIRVKLALHVYEEYARDPNLSSVVLQAWAWEEATDLKRELEQLEPHLSAWAREVLP